MSNPIILVVDDDVGVGRLCQRVLERSGFEVINLTSPRQGLRVLEQTRVDLLLVDIRMPEMDGFETMALAREIQPHLAVVIMTGFGNLDTAIQALRQGANGLLLKPFSETQELINAINDALEAQNQQLEITRLQAIQPLLKVAQELFAETDPIALVDLILDVIVDYLGCKHAGYYQRKKGSDCVELIGKRGNPPWGEESGVEASIIGQTDAWGVMVNVDQDEALAGDLHQSTLVKYGLGSVLCAPALRSEDKRSVIFAGRDQGQPFFAESEREMFVLLSQQIAIAMENAWLYKDLKDTLQQVEESRRALSQAEKMAAIGRLTASIAHEINNPLQAVSNCIHLIGNERLSAEKRQGYLGMAGMEIDRLMKTMRQMLDFYRPSAINREICSLGDIVKNVVDLLRKQMENESIQVEMEIPDDLSPVLAVNNQIQQVCFNIVLNAMEAMGGEGVLTFRGRMDEEFVMITIQDSGPGVPIELWESIFEPFVSSKDKGTGLGLSVSYNILEAHEGSLKLLDTKEAGACFQIALPVLTEEQWLESKLRQEKAL